MLGRPDTAASHWWQQFVRGHEVRVNHTLDTMAGHDLLKTYHSYAEIGAGPVLWGLSLLAGFNDLTGYDIDDWFTEVGGTRSIPVRYLDLNVSARLPEEYNCILLCQVLAHMGRWPKDVFAEIHDSLVPGGALVLTSQSLRRLSQRWRLLRGRPLFNAWGVENSPWGHVREYVPEEAVAMLKSAGFTDISWHYANLHDRKGIRATLYRLLVRLVPRLSSHYVVVAKRL